MEFCSTLLSILTCGLAGRNKTASSDRTDLNTALLSDAGQAGGQGPSGSTLQPQGSDAAPETPRTPQVSTKNILGLGHRDVNDDYELGQLLGQGAFAVVCKCRNRKTSDLYACKTIFKSKLNRRADVEDVRREVQILMMVSGHPNIASLVGIYEDEAAVHVILELCEGGEMLDEICDRGILSERDVSKYFRSMVNVVQHCHILGIMHRDIKPENFLLSVKGPTAVIKAADFGLSQFFRPGRPLRSLVGSAHFVAPEVIQRSYGPAADIWSLGVCLYVLLSGQTPFWGDTEEHVLEMVMNADIDYTSAPWGTISRQAKGVLRRMLDRNPDKRPTPSELLRHAWLCQAQRDTPLDSIVVERLRSMAVAIRVKRAAVLAASQGLEPEHLPRLHALFESLDVDRSGSLSAVELSVGLQRLNLPLASGGVDALVQSADKDGDGKVSLHEFLAACLEASLSAQEEYHEALVRQMDVNSDGCVSAAECVSVLHKYGVSDVDAQHIIKTLSRGNTVSVEEFSTFLVSHSESLKDAQVDRMHMMVGKHVEGRASYPQND